MFLDFSDAFRRWFGTPQYTTNFGSYQADFIRDKILGTKDKNPDCPPGCFVNFNLTLLACEGFRGLHELNGDTKKAFIDLLSKKRLPGLDIWKQVTRRLEIMRETNFRSVRLTGSPIKRDLEKCTAVFTEGVKCWRIDSDGHGRTRPVSLCVGSTDRKSDYEGRRKIHRGVYSGCEMSQLQYISTSTYLLQSLAMWLTPLWQASVFKWNFYKNKSSSLRFHPLKIS